MGRLFGDKNKVVERAEELHCSRILTFGLYLRLFGLRGHVTPTGFPRSCPFLLLSALPYNHDYLHLLHF